jgi:hypothetical protein
MLWTESEVMLKGLKRMRLERAARGVERTPLANDNAAVEAVMKLLMTIEGGRGRGEG